MITERTLCIAERTKNTIPLLDTNSPTLESCWTESGSKRFLLRCMSQLGFLPVDLSDTGFNKTRASQVRSRNKEGIPAKHYFLENFELKGAGCSVPVQHTSIRAAFPLRCNYAQNWVIASFQVKDKYCKKSAGWPP